MWCEGEGISLSYKLKRIREINLPRATPARMQQDDVAVWKDASNLRPRKYESVDYVGREV